MAHRLKKYASQVSLSRLLSFVNLSPSISGAGEITFNRFFSNVMLWFTRTTRLNKRAAELPQKLFNLLYDKVVFSVVNPSVLIGSSVLGRTLRYGPFIWKRS